MLSVELKNVVNVTYGIFRGMIGQMMKILDNLKQKDTKISLEIICLKNIEKSFKWTPSMVFIGVS